MNANSRKFQSILKNIRQPKSNQESRTPLPRRGAMTQRKQLTQEEIDEFCIYIDACAGYFNPEDDKYYDLEGYDCGDFEDYWGEHPHAFDPEAFGLDEGVYRDFDDLTFWAGERSNTFSSLSSAKRLEKLEELVINYLLDHEELDVQDCQIPAEYIEEAYHNGTSTEALIISGVCNNISPVWSSIQKVVYFPSDYPEMSNALLDVHEHLEKIKTLTRGCPHCWSRHTLNPADEVSDEYGYDLDLVEDIIGACEEGELDSYGPVQPDCAACQGRGIK